jgi:long-chain fatty acid transport protein
LTILLAATGVLHAQVGHVMQGAGVINRSMEGAATGNPIDMCGALYWNVGGLTQVKHSMLCIGNEFFLSDLSLGSSGPGGILEGDQDSDFPMSYIPTFGGTYKPEHSDWTFAFGMQSVAGFGVEFDKVEPGKPNPIFYPQSARGFGHVSSKYSLGQMMIGGACQVSEHLSLGIAPVLGFSHLEVDPFPGTRPNASGYPDVDGANAYGAGLNMGILYRFNPTWSVGVAHRTRIYFTDFNFDGEYPDGSPADFDFNLDMPSITSIGVGYTNTDMGLTVNLDLRYFDYEHADGFREDAEFDAHGAVKGFGWKSIFQVALGVQYKVTKKLTLRAGYSYNENPIEDEALFFNIEAPAIIQHHASIGFSYRINERLILNMAYSHGFENTVSGRIPGGGGSEVEARMKTDSVMIGFGYLL